MGARGGGRYCCRGRGGAACSLGSHSSPVVQGRLPCPDDPDVPRRSLEVDLSPAEEKGRATGRREMEKGGVFEVIASWNGLRDSRATEADGEMRGAGGRYIVEEDPGLEVVEEMGPKKEEEFDGGGIER